MKLPRERHDVDMGQVPVPHFGVHLKKDVFNKIIGENFNQSPSLFIKLKRFKLNYKKNQNKNFLHFLEN